MSFNLLRQKEKSVRSIRIEEQAMMFAANDCVAI